MPRKPAAGAAVDTCEAPGDTCEAVSLLQLRGAQQLAQGGEAAHVRGTDPGLRVSCGVLRSGEMGSWVANEFMA